MSEVEVSCFKFKNMRCHLLNDSIFLRKAVFFPFLPEIKVQMVSIACEQSDLTMWWLSILSLFMESFCNCVLLCLYETYSCGSQSCALIYLQTQWKDFAVQDKLETFSLFINTWMAFSALSLPFCISVKRLNNKGLLLWAMGQDFLAKLKQRYFTEEIFVSLFFRPCFPHWCDVVEAQLEMTVGRTANQIESKHAHTGPMKQISEGARIDHPTNICCYSLKIFWWVVYTPH